MRYEIRGPGNDAISLCYMNIRTPYAYPNPMP